MALADVFERFAGPDAPVQFLAYDGSKAGAPDSPIRITVKTPTAVAYLAQAPGALGLARAYVAGQLDLEGDMYTALARMASVQRIDLDVPERLRMLRQLGGLAAAVAAGAAAPAGGAGEPQVAGRAAALEGSRRERDLAPLRRVQHLL